ncbi:hypothetical protein DFQ30_008091 [Apophysomyces sp. BC1015]|nr:hypothetical protein DFQ30_008091 [Apophysomyces sp. BC1015]
MTTRQTKGILKTLHKKPPSVTSDSSGSSWLSRIQSKLYSTAADDLAVPSLPRQELRRVTFRVRQLTTEHILYSPDDSTAAAAAAAKENSQPKAQLSQDEFIDCSLELPKYYERACRMREEPPLDPFMDILRSGCLLIGDSLPELVLSHNPFKTKGFKYTAIFISESRAIRSLDLSRCLPDKKALQYLGQGIQIAPSLQHLSLDQCSLKSSMIEFLAEGVRQSVSLSSLSLRHNWISHNAAPWIAAMLLNDESIEMYWQSAEYQRRGIRQLDLTGNNLQHAVVPLAHALYSNSSLVNLLLENCQIRPEGCAILAESLCTNQYLQKLDLSSNPIAKGSDEGIQAIKTALAQNRTLIDLNLADTGLDSSAAIALAESLPENSTLTRLDLSKNPSITIAGVMALAVSIKMNDVLTFLDINIPVSQPSFVVTAIESYGKPNDVDLAQLQNDIVTACTANMQRNFSKQIIENDLPKASSSTSSASLTSSASSSSSHPEQIPTELQSKDYSDSNSVNMSLSSYNLDEIPLVDDIQIETYV